MKKKIYSVQHVDKRDGSIYENWYLEHEHAVADAIKDWEVYLTPSEKKRTRVEVVTYELDIRESMANASAEEIVHHFHEIDAAEELYNAATEIVNVLNLINCVTNSWGVEIDYTDAVGCMDDDLREELHFRLAPCSNQAFFDAYAAAHEERFEEEWELAKPNPVW